MFFLSWTAQTQCVVSLELGSTWRWATQCLASWGSPGTWAENKVIVSQSWTSRPGGLAAADSVTCQHRVGWGWEKIVQWTGKLEHTAEPFELLGLHSGQHHLSLWSACSQNCLSYLEQSGIKIVQWTGKMEHTAESWNTVKSINFPHFCHFNVHLSAAWPALAGHS